MIAFFANYLPFFFLLPLIVVFFTRRRHFFMLVIAALFSWLAASVIKDFFYFPRPYILSHSEPLIHYLLDGSFPSGHTAVASSLTLLLLKWYRKFGYASLAVTVVMAIARVVSGVHAPIDILGGILLGILVALGVDSCHSQ